MIAETITAKNRPEAIEPFDKTWGVGVSGLDEDISPFPRINRMLEKTRGKAISYVDTERARIMTESWLEKHRGEPALKRVANCFYDLIAQVEIHIEKDELIVGEVGAPAWTAPLYPEFCTWMTREFDQIERGEIPDFIDRHNDKYIVTDEQRKIIRELWAKWKGVNQGEMITAEMHPEALKGSGYIWTNALYTNNGIGHVCADYPKLMKLDYGGLRKLVQAKLDDLSNHLGDDGDAQEKYEFWTAQMISLDASELYFKRYGALAQEQANACTDPVRKAELERIASNCNWVATNPPRDYWEAMQLWYGGTCLILIESNGHSVTYGRFDQIMGPFYENDIKNGTLTREFMQELIECSFIKMDHLRKIRDYPEIQIASGIGWGGTALNVGGVDAEGNDAVNDVSYMVLDAHAHTRITNPWMGVKLSEKNPKEFWIKTFNVCRIGTGEPKIYNDDMYYNSMLQYGVPLEQARNWVGIGCVEPEVPGYTYGFHDAAYFGSGKVLVLALNNGVDPTTGEAMGAPTGYLRDMKSFDEVKAAFETQMKYWIDRMISSINTVDKVHQRNHPLPYLSLLINDCIDKGQDVSRGGARYNFTGPQMVGLGTVTDSLCTIKQLIFDEKKITGADLEQALKDNWVGHEALHAYVNSDKVHHYGNNDDYADDIAKFVIETYCKNVEHRPNARGGEYRPGVYSVSINVALGLGTEATPDGRCNCEPLSDCLGPAHPQGISHDVRGPLAIAESLSKLNQTRIANGVILNWKFTPDTLSGDGGLDNFVNLFRGYFAKGGLQSQFNVTSREILEAAQDKPDDYKDLMVRVAGYSAFFTELSPELQTDLIGRTELSF